MSRVYGMDEFVRTLVDPLVTYYETAVPAYEVVEDASGYRAGGSGEAVPFRRLVVRVDTGGDGVFSFAVEVAETTSPSYRRDEP